MRVRSIAERAVIAVCGSNTLNEPELEALAEEVGSEIIRRGMNLVTGGLGGVMTAASRGAARARENGEGDGIIIGVLPGTSRSAANPYCDVVIPTGIGYARNSIVVASADGVILVHGGAGTLSEAAYAWQMGKPIVALLPSGGWAGRLGGQRVDGRRTDAVIGARTPAEAVSLLDDELSGIR
jgi:uncharacterized protein (TIGR00725 family)